MDMERMEGGVTQFKEPRGRGGSVIIILTALRCFGWGRLTMEIDMMA